MVAIGLHHNIWIGLGHSQQKTTVRTDNNILQIIVSILKCVLIGEEVGTWITTS